MSWNIHIFKYIFIYQPKSLCVDFGIIIIFSGKAFNTFLAQ